MKTPAITAQQIYIAKEILKRVFDVMEYNKEMSSGLTKNHNGSIYTDNGSFILSLSKKQVKELKKFIELL